MFDYTDLLGKPFELGTRGPDKFDCWGICLELGKRVGLYYPMDFTPKYTDLQDEVIKFRRDTDFIKIEKPEPFCIATFSMTPPFVDHCGFVLEDCKHFIHILKNHSVTKQRLDNRILAKRMQGFYRLKDNGNN